MTNEQFIIEIKKRKNILFIFLLLVFIFSLYLQFNYYNNFSAKNDFSIASSEMIDLGTYNPNEPERFYFDRTGTNRVFTMVTSTELLDRVVKKFNLYTHYNIDTLAPYHYESVIGILMKKVSVKKTDFNTLSVTATDKDPEVAADMANYVVELINVIYRSQYMSRLEQKITFYQRLMKDISFQDSLQRNKLYNLLNDIKASSAIFKQGTPEYAKLNDQLIAVTNQLQASSDNLLKTYQLYRSAYHSLEVYDLQTVTVIRKALPDRGKGVFRKIIVSTVITFFFFSLILTLFYYTISNKSLLKLIFLKSQTKEIK